MYPVIIGTLALVSVLGILVYNNILKRKFLLKEASSGVDVQLKRRADLIPRLVDITKGYMRYEQDLLQDLVLLRSKAQGAQNMNERGSVETGISHGLKTIFALAENYPDLKSSNNFLELHKSLVETEDQLQMARRYYNGAVRDYNIAIETFPGLLIAGVFGFKKADFFELEYATDRIAPEVNINVNKNNGL